MFRKCELLLRQIRVKKHKRKKQRRFEMGTEILTGKKVKKMMIRKIINRQMSKQLEKN